MRIQEALWQASSPCHGEMLMHNIAHLEGGLLPAARLPDDGKGAARQDMHIEAVKDGHQRARRVAKGHIAQLYVP